MSNCEVPGRMHRKRLLSLFRRFVPLLLVFGILHAVSCTKDESPLAERLTLYMYLCPTGIEGCYGGCGVKSDRDGDGIVDAEETPTFNSCTGYCDSYCNITYLLLLAESE